MSVLKNQSTIIRFLWIIVCISFTKANVSSCRKPQTFRKLQYQPENLTTILNTVQAQTRLQCIASCLEDSNCTTVTFDEATHVCNLLPTDVTPPSLPTSVAVYSMYEPILSCGAEETGSRVANLGAAGQTTFICDNRWAVIQNRKNRDVKFKQNYQTYVDGFGDVNGDFWWGLERIHILTTTSTYKLRIEMEHRYRGDFYVEEYSSFQVQSAAAGYKLSVLAPSGNASDGLTRSNGMKFSTFDKDQDTEPTKHCATVHHGGWWYSDCFGVGDIGANLNGPPGSCYGIGANTCILWQPLEISIHTHHGLHTARMMIK